MGQIVEWTAGQYLVISPDLCTSPGDICNDLARNQLHHLGVWYLSIHPQFFDKFICFCYCAFFQLTLNLQPDIESSYLFMERCYYICFWLGQVFLVLSGSMYNFELLHQFIVLLNSVFMLSMQCL